MALTQIENDQVDRVKTYHEISLTDELINSGRYLTHGKPYSIVTIDSLKEHEDIIPKQQREFFLQKAVEYRKLKPIEWPYNMSACTGENIDEFCKHVLMKKKYYDKSMNEYK